MQHHHSLTLQALRSIEGGYTALLRVGDLDRLAENPASDRGALFEQRKLVLGSCFSALGIDGSNPGRADYVLGVAKGVRLLSRLIPLLFPDQVSRLPKTSFTC